MQWTGTGTNGKYCSSTAAALPELRLHKFSLRTSCQLKSRFALRTSILRMFRDLLVNPPNPTEMMCLKGICVEHCLCSIRPSIKGLMRSSKDWTLMLQPYLILSLSKYSTEIGFKGFQIRIINVHCVCSVKDFEFNLKTLKRFNVGT